jgi:putative phosphoesterase
MLEGIDRILHAGDVGPGAILTELEALAPVTGVWGNTDGFEIRARLPEVARIEIAGHQVLITHGHQFGYPTPESLVRSYPEADMILFGHTHVPIIERIPSRGGRSTLAVNPGSCGPRRSDLLPTLCLAEFSEEGISVELLVIPES